MKQNDITLTEKAAEELRALQHRSIGLPDIDAPEVSDWQRVVVGKFYRPVKKQVTLRLDADVLEWYRQVAEKYQTLINAACREYMLIHQKKMAKKVKRK